MLSLESEVIEVNGAKIYYERKGVGHPLVLVHGHPLDSRMWDTQFENLSEHFDVIRFDLAGYGKSGVHQNDFSLVDDIKGLLDFLNINKTHLLGLSVGGMLSMDFMLKYPEMVSKVILVSTGLLGWNDFSLERQRFTQELTKADDQNQVIELMTKAWVAGPFRALNEVDQQVTEQFSAMVHHTFSKERGQGKMITPAAKTIDLVGGIKVPTLILEPEYDFPEFNAIAEYLHKKIIDSKKVCISGTAHMINMEKPVEFNKQVIEFLF